MKRTLPKLAFLLVLALTGSCAAPLFGQTECTFDVSQFGRTQRTSPELVRLQSELIDPHFSVSVQLIQELAAEEEHDASLGPSESDRPLTGKGPAMIDVERQRELVGKYLDLLAIVLPQKESEAQVESMWILTEQQHLRGAPMSEATQQCVQKAVASVFPLLPFEKQWTILLEGNYPVFKSAALASYLRHVYESLEQYLPDDPEFDRDTSLRFHRTQILKRIYEADSLIGREMILNEIKSELPRCDIEVLRMLPDETLPAMDHAFSEQLPSVYENANWDEYNAKLGAIERYATAAVLPAMKALFSNDPDNRNQYHAALFLSYFLRTDREFGRRLVEGSLRSSEAGSSNTVLTDMALIRPQSELREIATRHLDDPDRRIAENAVYVFKWLGIQGVESLLWEHFEAWHKEWATKSGPIPYPEQAFEDSLVEALLFGRGRCESRETAEKLKRMYIKGNSADGNIRFPEWREPVRIMFEPHTNERPMFIVDSCAGVLSFEEVKDAIPSFSRQTEFEWHGSPDTVLESWLAPMRAEIERLIRQQGMSLRVQGKE